MHATAYIDKYKYVQLYNLLLAYAWKIVCVPNQKNIFNWESNQLENENYI